MSICKKTGFTLIESLVCIGIFTLIFAVLVGLIIWLYSSLANLRTINELSFNLERALSLINQEVRTANSIYYPSSSENQLSLEVRHYLPSGETFSYVDFFICGTQLCLKKESSPPLALTSDRLEVEKLKFDLISTTSDSASVQTTLTLKHKHPSSGYYGSLTATSSAALRNY